MCPLVACDGGSSFEGTRDMNVFDQVLYPFGWRRRQMADWASGAGVEYLSYRPGQRQGGIC